MIESNKHRRHKTRSRRRAFTLLPIAALTAALVACHGDQLGELPPPISEYQQEQEEVARQRVEATFHLDVIDEMSRAVNETIASGNIPGGVLWVERNNVDFVGIYGYRTTVPQRERMTRDTVFDIASLTKVVATTPAIMKLVDQGKIDLGDTAQKYIAEFSGHGKEQITIRQLLTHTSGLRPDISTQPTWSGYDTAIKMINTEKVYQPPGTQFRYSDINFIILAEVVRRVSGRRIDEFAQQEIFRPLKMNDTRFVPHSSEYKRIAPTELLDGRLLHGIVHDPTARYMGGVAGHAGLFSTVDDLARFSRMLLNEGELDGIRVLNAETVRLMTTVQSPDAVEQRRGLGWDIDSDYGRPRGDHFPIGSYGHAGYTGTSLWIDPFSQTFLIFLSSRLHPDGSGNVHPLQAKLGNLAARAVKGFDFTSVEGALPPRDTTTKEPLATKTQVLNGIDVLTENNFAALRGLKIGLITNHTGRDRNGSATIDLLNQSRIVDLVALFSPEHGIRGEIDAHVDDGVDDKTGLPIYSLYGKRRAPLPDQIAGLDALVFDIQDIGTRFYTYISTMGHSMEAASKAGVKFIVLDRLNPITGSIIEGPVLDGDTDFVGWHEIPVRHGMTVGELAQMFNAERGIGVDLEVIRLSGWSRDLWPDKTTMPWVNTSPNIRSLTQAALYPGVGLLETTHLAVGRGTDTPFELFGAPYIDGELLAKRMNAFGIRGVRFDPVVFTPAASKFKSQQSEGVRITLTDRDHCDVINIGIAAALTLNKLYAGKFGLDRFNGLLKDEATMEAIRAGRSLNEIRKLWEPGLRDFADRRRQYLLY